MMKKGYVWIVTDEIASLLDSLESSINYNMQGVLGFITNFVSSTEAFKQFKTKFRNKYGSEYPEEENANPSVFSLRAYDATWAIARTINKLGSVTSEKLLESNFDGLSGKISFKNGTLSQLPIFRIINVVGKSYRERGFWSPKLGFSENFIERDSMEVKIVNSSGILGPMFWPGGSLTVPKGWASNDEDKPLQIGVPAKGAFKQFLRVSYDQELNRTFCLWVFN